MLDNVIIPRDYPEVSSRVADKTILGSLQFSELLAKLHIHPLQGWTVEPDKEMVLLFGACIAVYFECLIFVDLQK